MWRGSGSTDHRSIKYVLDKYHELIRQHLDVKDMVNLTSVHPALHRFLSTCNACWQEVYFNIDIVELNDFEDARIATRSNRRYRNYRFMCYDNPSISLFALKMLDVLEEMILGVEVIDMRIEYNTEDVTRNYPTMREFKVTAFSGDYKNVFLSPYTVYESLSFESLEKPVDLKDIFKFQTASRKLHFKNCGIKNWESFNFFDGHCRNLYFEYNKKSDFFDDLIMVIQKCSDVTEFEIKSRKEIGFCLHIFHRLFGGPKKQVVKKPPTEETELFSRRQDQKEESTSGKTLLWGPPPKTIRLEVVPEDQLHTLFYRRRSRSTGVSVSEESTNDSTSATNEKPSETTTIKLSIEVHKLTLPMLEALAVALPKITKLKIYSIPNSMVEKIFTTFKCLQTITDAKDKNPISRETFNFTSRDPMMKLPRKVFDLCFQHFTMQDFCTASKVSKMWYEVLGGCERFTLDLVLKLSPQDFKSNNDEILKKSSRNYSKMEFSCDNQSDYSVRAINIIHVFSSTLTEITLTNFHLKRVGDVKDRLLFDRLRHLKFYDVDSSTVFLLIQNTTTLYSLLLSEMPITEYICERLKKNPYINSVSFLDCNFDYFANVRKPEKKKGYGSKGYVERYIGYYSSGDEEEPDPTIKLPMKVFELSFDRVGAWKEQDKNAFKNFMTFFSIRSVEHLKLSGVRGEHLVKLVDSMSTIRRLQIRNVWASDLNAMSKNVSYRQYRDFHEVGSLTLSMGDEIDFKKLFPGAKQIHLKRDEYFDLDPTSEAFKKLMKPSSTRMMAMNMLVPRQMGIGYKDPIINIPEELHPLLFQHLNIEEILTLFEVSKTWNNFCKKSPQASAKYLLFMSKDFKPEVRKVFEDSSRIYVNVMAEFYSPKMIQNFNFVRRLSVTFIADEKFSSSETFPHLETLIIMKCLGKFYNADNVLECFRIFSKCTNLTFLEIYESVTFENAPLIWDMLENNRNLKTLKIHQCSEFYHLFAEDNTHRVKFNVSRLHYGIPQKFKLTGSKFEENLNKFILSQKSTLKILDLNLASAGMLNMIFREMTNIEVLRMLRITGYDALDLQIMPSIKEFVFPDTLLLGVLNSHQSFDHMPVMKAIPNVELLYIYSLSHEMVDYAAKNYKSLKILTYERTHGEDASRYYAKMLRDPQLEHTINREIVIRQVSFILTDNEDRTFDRIFGIRRRR